MALIKCYECGAEISDKAELCPKCGCPVKESVQQLEIVKAQEKQKSLKNIIFIGIALVIIIGVIALFGNLEPGYYNGLKWGTAKEEVMEQLKDSEIAFESGEDKIIDFVDDYNGFSDVTALMGYYFENDELFKVIASLMRGDNCEYDDDELTQLCVEKFKELYGKYEEDNGIYTWTTKESQIKIMHSDGFIFINYLSLDHVEE